MKDLRIHLTTGIYPPDKGGPAFFTSEFSRWLSKYVNETKVISLRDGASKTEFESGHTLTLISRNSRLPLRMLSSALSVIQPVFKKKIILMNGLFLEVLIASFFSRSPIVAKVPGDIVWERARNQGRTILSIDEYQGSERGFERVFRFFFTWSLKKARVVIAPSFHLKSLIENWGIDSKNIVIIRNSVDTKFFLPEPEKRKKYDLITVCRLVPWKGVEEIIRVCAEKGLTLAVVGDGPELVHLKQTASQLKANVSFLGDYPHDQLPGLLNSARIFVLNSQYEGSPHALIEGLSVGLTAIARESTGSTEVIQDKVNGLLCGKTRSLSEAVSIALDNPSLNKRMQSAARSSAIADFDMENNFNKILRMMEGLG